MFSAWQLLNDWHSRSVRPSTMQYLSGPSDPSRGGTAIRQPCPDCVWNSFVTTWPAALPGDHMVIDLHCVWVAAFPVNIKGNGVSPGPQ
eukprot:8978470-Pyramimonas_sp.AAC.1